MLVAMLLAAFLQGPPGPLPKVMAPACGVHDPTLAKEGNRYYCFSTNGRIGTRWSDNLIDWHPTSPVFTNGVPVWVKTDVPKARDLWAPELKFFRHKWHLYDAVSSFGAKKSAIGVATSPTLDSTSPNYKWTDEGKLIDSDLSTPYNAIDPAPFLDDNGKLYMAFGSFSNGLYEVQLDPQLGTVVAGAEPILIAKRPENAIEGPSLFKREGYYYLLASYDFCCRGTQSTYNIRVGRSRMPEGPFVDRKGMPLTEGGGTLLLASYENVVGPGGQSVLQEGRKFWLANHFYDGELHGVPTLQVRPIEWTRDGWPVPGSPVGVPESKDLNGALTSHLWSHRPNFAGDTTLRFFPKGDLDAPNATARWNLTGNR